MLAALLLHVRIAMVMTFLLSIIFGLVNSFSVELVLVSAVQGIVIIGAGARARTTDQVALRAGLLSGFAGAFTVLFLAIPQPPQHIASGWMTGLDRAVDSQTEVRLGRI